MLKLVCILCLLTLIFSHGFSQDNNPVFKNEVSLGMGGVSYLPSGFFSVNYKRNFKKVRLFGKFNYNYESSETVNSLTEAGGETGVLKNAYIFKNNKWLLFYGVEIIFFYAESHHDTYNVYGTYYGASLISGLEFIVCKHFSLSTQINPGFVKSKYNLFLKTK
jgi:hypothetical protein